MSAVLSTGSIRAVKHVVRFEDVSLDFDGQNALDRVSFGVAPGESRVILGSAGSGKTVLLKLTVGLIKPTGGRIFLFDQDITHEEDEDLIDKRALTGILFQEGGLFDSLTIEENVAYPLLNQRSRKSKPPSPAEVEAKVREALRFVELEHTLEKFPSELSGGMRRRVGIARAIVTTPPLVLYDSPTAGLDPITANTIMALILKERDTRGTTTMIVTHRYQDGNLMANFRYNPNSGELERVPHGDSAADRKVKFMVLQDGRLVFEGTERELQASRDPYISKFVKR
jgi:phospholipid/cholesterol/gamma-HCH transport system ATP-binding protein